MKTSQPNPGFKHPALCQAALLFLILAVLFWRSFLPEYVHFNNDGPLGQQNNDWQKLPGAFTGMWDDLNHVGYSAGSFSPCVSIFVKWLLGPVGFAKFYAPIGLFILGLGAWSFLRSLKLTPLAASLGAVAICLSPTFFGGACWGIAAVEIAMGLDFFALALLTSSTAETPWLVRWLRVALAGLCVGMNVIEAADIGGICSICVAVYAFYQFIIEGGGNLAVRVVQSGLRVAMVALFAGFIAAQAIVSLIGTSVTGIADTGQDEQSKQVRWDFATQFSLPKKETLGIIVPGLFGYKYDTPKDMMPPFLDDYRNGVYWGGIGRLPLVDRFLDSGAEGNPPASALPFGYAGYYSGILVMLIVAWTIFQSLRRENSLFPDRQKKFIWFWAVVLVFSLLLAWGRFAPAFYGTLYALPYFSTIRNPVKFIILFCWATTALFAYGVNALNRRYLDSAGPTPTGTVDQLQKWWQKAGSFDRRWTMGCAVFLAASVAGWLAYDSQMPQVISYLARLGFENDSTTAENSATQIAAFSLHQVAWAIGLLVIALGIFTLTIAGCFSGRRAKIGMLLLGGFLIFDMGRANLPWIDHWDYKKKYEVGSLNPVVDFLRHDTFKHRVAGLPFDPQQQLRGYDYLFGGNGMYRIEWMQHHFPYYNIQCLELIQMPRMPEDMKLFEEALHPQSEAEYPKITRHWELTNTRYLLGAAGFLNILNQQLDPGKGRYKIAQRFDLVVKPGVLRPSQLEDFTVVTNNDGELALFDFTGALPRAKLYGNWLVSTNDPANLAVLADLNFDPAKTVLVSTPQKDLPASGTNQNSGSVDITSYSTKHIILAADVITPSVLLLNDKYDPHWKVTVDGQTAGLLRCNFMMRGVYLQPGKHTVEFDFRMPTGPLYVTSAGVALAFVRGAARWLLTRKKADQATS